MRATSRKSMSVTLELDTMNGEGYWSHTGINTSGAKRTALIDYVEAVVEKRTDADYPSASLTVSGYVVKANATIGVSRSVFIVKFASLPPIFRDALKQEFDKLAKMVMQPSTDVATADPGLNP